MTQRGLVLFALMSVIWGIPYLFIRVAVDEISPATLVFVRTTIGAAILLPIALVRVDMRAILVRWRWVVTFAAVEIAIPWVMPGRRLVESWTDAAPGPAATGGDAERRSPGDRTSGGPRSSSRMGSGAGRRGDGGPVPRP